MNKYFKIICLALTNILYCQYIYSYPISINKFENFDNKNVCLLNYNKVYNTFYSWSKENKNYQSKIINDTIWLNKNRFISPTIVIGIYNTETNLNYICLLRVISKGRFKILNIFANPYNNFDDDTLLFENILNFCTYNKYTLDIEKLKDIDNGKYYFTYLYKYLNNIII